jgi:hypothetical protein
LVDRAALVSGEFVERRGLMRDLQTLIETTIEELESRYPGIVKGHQPQPPPLASAARSANYRRRPSALQQMRASQRSRRGPVGKRPVRSGELMAIDAPSGAGGTIAYRNCPRCGLSIPEPFHLQLVSHCPRCLARHRLLIEMFYSALPAHTLYAKDHADHLRRHY